MKRYLIVLSFFFVTHLAAQQGAVNDSLQQFYSNAGEVKSSGRKWLIGTGTALGYGGSFIFLNAAWYKDFPRTSFHTYNDAGEWQQMDKAGHVWTTYHTSRIATGLWQWAGVAPEKSVLLGTGSSLLYMLSIEYLDGRSAEWGWSWADVGSNVIGATTFAAQQLAWKEQKIQIKFSSFPKKYSADLRKRADDLFGSSFQGKLLKDYNAQTYWLSVNLKFLLPEKILPEWLNIAVGYGAEGMLGGYENLAYDKSGNIIFDRRDIRHYRQWFLSPDVDFTRIKTKSRFLRTLFFAANLIKFPAPAVEFSKGKFRLQAISY